MSVRMVWWLVHRDRQHDRDFAMTTSGESESES